MELRDAVRQRRMVRRFDPSREVGQETVQRLLELAVRAPSAGFSQGWDFVVLRGDECTTFWDVTTDDGLPDSWLAGVSTAPVLIICCSDKSTYLRRYARDDKPWQDESETHWPVPYWDVDTGMAAMLMLLGAVDEGLGALFFGVQVERLDAVRETFGIPADRGLVGVISLGYAADPKPSGSTRSVRRRSLAEVTHFGRFGQHASVTGHE
ncbi:nitroreductase family protein [Flexivirga caeni]|uniref:Nitroreductase family protein n=1 Tax=Flexivirga caeni TaxID=2294115 RepID=A0A3M9LZL4_9MICO|nr:nitroreductase family protein [Flexivirga caeni]RNI18365.1 nitroreductase family protein [Flexivirga caeni]